MVNLSDYNFYVEGKPCFISGRGWVFYVRIPLEIEKEALNVENLILKIDGIRTIVSGIERFPLSTKVFKEGDNIGLLVKTQEIPVGLFVQYDEDLKY